MINDKSVDPIHADISLVDNDVLDIEGFKKWRPEFADSEFICEEDGTFICGHEVEKMSKSKYNVQTPDELVEKFGADTLRMYEMFLGPLEQSKPWDTKGINGVHNFLRKFWRLFHDENNNVVLDNGEPSKDSLKSLHKTIKKIGEDLERFSFNTGVSNYMICVNELTDQKCNNAQVLEQLVILLSPYAPHICEELWVRLGKEAGTLSYADFPKFIDEHLVEANHSYPVSFNGKMRFKVELPTALSKDEVEKEVLAHELAAKWLDGKEPKKVIVVPGKIVNVVV
jgi:leucyl-tRNA synthetase